MSRYTIANDKFSIAYGVDHVMGGFFQIWRADPASPFEDIALVDVDSFGVRLRWSEEDDIVPNQDELDEKLRELLGVNCWSKIIELKLRFDLARKQGTLHPNIHASDVVDTIRPLGFSDEQHQQIYRAFD